MENKYNTKQIAQTLLKDYEDDSRMINKMQILSQPDTGAIRELLKKLITIAIPGYLREKEAKIYESETLLTVLLEEVIYELDKQIAIALRHKDGYAEKSEAEIAEETAGIVEAFLQRLPRVREYLETDVEAAYNGDPAAFNKDEIILSYPGFRAIMINRIAHELYMLGVPLIPRAMTEYAHSRTGIDIHPGVTIGKYFFIDHGTGIVIGETSIIGEHVKIYQGVTIGALSTKSGQLLKGTKRHPTIEDNVTIYAGASILGGETVIGHDSTIGSNAFITKSLTPGTKVSVKNQELSIKEGGNW